MKLFYIANVRFPTEKAHGIQIIKMCEAFANAGLEGSVRFLPGVPNDKTVEFYRQNKIFVNLTHSGSLDKTILEAMACGTLILVTNKYFQNIFSEELVEKLICEEDDSNDVAQKLKILLSFSLEEEEEITEQLRGVVVSKHSLSSLIKKINYFYGKTSK